MNTGINRRSRIVESELSAFMWNKVVHFEIVNQKRIFLYKFICLFVYLFMAVLGLHCCTQAFSSCGERGLLFVVACGLQARGLSSCGSQALEPRLSSCGARAQLLCGMWDLPGPGLEPMSPALAGGFLTTVPPGKPKKRIFYKRSQ